MLLIKLFFVAASLITQAYLFRESPGPSHPSPSQSPSLSPSSAPFPAPSPTYEAEARRADSTLYVTYGIVPSAAEGNRSTAGSDTSPTGEPCALR
jgi:hypothetical protein